TFFTANLPEVDPSRPRTRTDHAFEFRKTNKTGHYIGPWEPRKFLFSVPEGLRKVLNYIKDKYNNPIVYIKENGINDYDDGTTSKEEILRDEFRLEYHQKHLQQLHKAIVEDGCDVRGYYAWSLLDNFEWEYGYSARFGLYYVDYNDDLKRHPKDSAKWFKRFLERGSPVGDDDDDVVTPPEEFQVISREESREGWNVTLGETEGFEAPSTSSSLLSLMVNRSWRGQKDHCTVFDYSNGRFCQPENALSY
ncbi:PREDICTED: beta-glucosidase 30-like, partial [Tarenaya hassleriana]|uniref:beta-glucosidase 30-like n=1 Tax=Tarenaya hassleriana TaxID=28532 RepID=UPI0008FD2528